MCEEEEEKLSCVEGRIWKNGEGEKKKKKMIWGECERNHMLYILLKPK